MCGQTRKFSDLESDGQQLGHNLKSDSAGHTMNPPALVSNREEPSSMRLIWQALLSRHCDGAGGQKAGARNEHLCF